MPSPFARRLNTLFDQWEHRHGRSLSNADFCRQLAARGHPVSKPYLSQLRYGRRANPAPALASAMAEFFGMEPDHFSHPSAPDAPDPATLATQFRTPGLRRLVATATGLSAESLDLLADIATRLRHVEDLPPDNHSAQP
ncbi:transcriptional regulator [Nocardia sp. NPDC051981]|uniref:helix-turn-helix domain-containing protein n=1 Tax=Nocardia sp. NPDC051981 TaxID=3155417 RepID=UPI00343ECC0D